MDLVGFGALNWDHLTQVEPFDDFDAEVCSIRKTGAPGGSAANTVYAAARLGLDTAFIGAIGDDLKGQEMLESFENVGVDISRIAVKRQMESGEAICITDPNTTRFIVIEPNANSSFAKYDYDEAMTYLRADLPRAVHFSSFASMTQLQFQMDMAEHLRSSSPKVMLSCAPGTIYVRKGRGAISGLLGHCHILFFNRSEITGLWGLPLEDYELAAEKLLAEYTECEAVIVTLGRGRGRAKRGHRTDIEQLLLTSSVGGALERHPSSIVVARGAEMVHVAKTQEFGTVMDTTGAGDAYAAGFIFGRLKGFDWAGSALAGHVLAQFSVLGLGSRGHLPGLKDFEQRFTEISRSNTDKRERSAR